MNALLKYVRLYGFDHTRTQAQLEVAWKELREALPKRKGSIELEVADDQVLLNGAQVEAGQAERAFTQLLNGAGLASIQFKNQVNVEDFESLVRVLAFGGSKALGLANHLKQLFPDDKGNIRVKESKATAETPAPELPVDVQVVANSLTPEFREWLNEPAKLVQLIVAAEGTSNSVQQHTDQLSFNLEHSAAEISDEIPSVKEVIFTLSERETVEALRLLTRFAELGADPSSKPEMIGLELHRSDEKVRKTVLSTLDELSASHDEKSKKPLLMRAGEQIAIRYALERFESGDLRVSGVRQLLEVLSEHMAALRKLVSRQTGKGAATISSETPADQLDQMFWEEVPEHGKKQSLSGEDAACIPANSVRHYAEVLLKRDDRNTATEILRNYAAQVNSGSREYRAKAADGLPQLVDMLSAVGGNVLGECSQKLGDALSKNSDPDLETLLSAAFVRLSSEAALRKQYRAVAQSCETMDYLASRRPALEKELRSRIGVEARLPELIEDALSQLRFAPDLLSVLHHNSQAAAEHLAERFFRSMRREECDRIVDLVHELGISGNNYLREMLRNGPQRQAVSSVGLLSRLDVPGLLEFLPMRLPGWNRFYHDVIVRQIAYGAAPDRGRTLLEILEILDPAVVPQALDEIGMSGDRSAAPPLIVMAEAGETQGRSPLLQLKAIEALGRLREPDAVPVLRNLFEAKRMFKWQHHRELRIAAAQALAKIDPRYATKVMADSGLEPGELAIGPLDSAPACPWVRQRRYERIVLRKPVTAIISSSWGKSTLSVREVSLGGGMGSKDDSLRIGSDADIDIQVGMRHIRGQVLLRRARVNEVGFEFVNTDLDSRHRLRHLLMDSLEHTPENRPGKWNFDRNG